MMDNDTRFLPFFFQEPVYVVPDPQGTPSPDPISADSVQERVYAPLGENRRQILVLVDAADDYYLEAGNQELLVKILQALGLALEDVWLVNVAQAPSPDCIAEEISFLSCISFGMPPEPWQFSNFFRKYEVMKDETERAFLFSDTLTEIGQDVAKKKRLWLSLKTLFQHE